MSLLKIGSKTYNNSLNVINLLNIQYNSKYFTTSHNWSKITKHLFLFMYIFVMYFFREKISDFLEKNILCTCKGQSLPLAIVQYCINFKYWPTKHNDVIMALPCFNCVQTPFKLVLRLIGVWYTILNEPIERLKLMSICTMCE